MKENDRQTSLPGLIPLDASLPVLKPPGRIQKRLIDSNVAIQQDDPESLLFQHSVFCQTGLPYRDPGDHVLSWERSNGHVALSIEAGKAYDPEAGKYQQQGLPFGPKPRLILAHLNAEALRCGSPEIEVGSSLTQFARRIYRNDPNGHELRLLKNQLGRLSVSLVRMALVEGNASVQIQTNVITKLDLWFPKTEGQRVLWPSTVQLDGDYFASLQKHAVPLDERAVAALAHSAMALDVYAWLAQRLHRISKGKPQLVPWASLHRQFGWSYKRVRDFRSVFLHTLGQVQSQYPRARIAADEQGVTLSSSPPPISSRAVLVSSR